jgi:hypothetical protein
MRLLLLLLLAGIAAYVTVPTQAQQAAAAQAALQAYHPDQAAPQSGFSLDDIVGYAKGVMAGQGSYQNYYVASRYTVDMPGPDYLECYGAFTMVKCQVRRS